MQGGDPRCGSCHLARPTPPARPPTRPLHPRENAISASLSHPNIITYYGLCVSPPHISLVFELCSRDSLWSLIEHVQQRREAWQLLQGAAQEEAGGAGATAYGAAALYGATSPRGRAATPLPARASPPTLSWRHRLRIARGAASALAYLHACEPPILHRDIKSQNFLVTSRYEARLSDFGESRARAGGGGGSGAPMTGEVGTLFWMAPELWRGEEYGESADVYGLGIVLWELLALARPYEGVPRAHLPMLVSAQRRRPAMPPAAPPAWLRLVTACWDDDAAARPTAAAVCAALKAMTLAELRRGGAEGACAARGGGVAGV